MCNADGRPTGKKVRLGPGDDAHKIAGRLTREAWLKRTPESDFNRSTTHHLVSHEMPPPRAFGRGIQWMA
jgi:hypothetical protein